MLALTEISYSQLYRWKRKGLIPESWFIRRSTFTGQETFLPRDEILARIDQIKALKEVHALDELVEVLHAPKGTLRITHQTLQAMGWSSDVLLPILQVEPEDQRVFSRDEVLCLGVLRRLSQHANREELVLAHDILREHLAQQRLGHRCEDNQVVYFIRKRVSGGAISAEISLVVITNRDALFDAGTQVVASVNLESIRHGIELDLAAVSPSPHAGSSDQIEGDDTPQMGGTRG